MAKDENRIEAWTLDQLAKSTFFHRKLHEWKLLEVGKAIDEVRGEELVWDDLNISEQAWKRVIHRGIKPVLVFAHPQVLQKVDGAVGYYRMLAMVSQKSMKRIGLNLDSYELGKAIPDESVAATISSHLNRIISVLVEADSDIDMREFELWRGMAAGTQAQGSWQNKKGSTAEIAVREIILRRLQLRGLLAEEQNQITRVNLGEGRLLVFADEPDIAIYRDGIPQVAVEVKGGIDQAGVLERIGAALKSLHRTRRENTSSTTILLVQEVSMTETAEAELRGNEETITERFNLNDVIESTPYQEQFFRLLGI